MSLLEFFQLKESPFSITIDNRFFFKSQQHAEALTRLEALWRSWETLRLDPNLGIATWLTNYLDPQLAALTSRIGTFAQCTQERHATAAVMPTS